MAEALDCWDYELVEESQRFSCVLCGACQDVDVVAQLPAKLYSDMDSIDGYGDEILL